jgi:hypothetical protein
VRSSTHYPSPLSKSRIEIAWIEGKAARGHSDCWSPLMLHCIKLPTQQFPPLHVLTNFFPLSIFYIPNHSPLHLFPYFFGLLYEFFISQFPNHSHTHWFISLLHRSKSWKKLREYSANLELFSIFNFC